MGKAFVLGQRQWIPTAWNVHSNASRLPNQPGTSRAVTRGSVLVKTLTAEKCCRHSIGVDDCQIGTGNSTNGVTDPAMFVREPIQRCIGTGQRSRHM